MRVWSAALVCAAFVPLNARHAWAQQATPRGETTATAGSKPWCAPEVSELSDHVCFFDGGVPADGRRTLVVYLHGVYGTTPAFQWLQQRALAIHAKRLAFTVLLPTSPKAGGLYQWPTSRGAQDEQDPGIVTALRSARARLENRLGHGFDETFVVGFSSGAYYASSLALRGVLNVDGYAMLAGAASWVRPEGPAAKRAPVFVGISAADPQTASHSRAFASTLASLGWPYRAEERDAGHMVDWALIEHALRWLRSRTPIARSPAAEAVR